MYRHNNTRVIAHCIPGIVIQAVAEAHHLFLGYQTKYIL